MSLDRQMETESRKADYVMIRICLDIFLTRGNKEPTIAFEEMYLSFITQGETKTQRS